MPQLVHPASGRSATLGVRTLVGRAPTCTLRLTHRRVSGEHAVIVFTQARWTLRDLGSHNGTAVDGKAAPVGEPVELRAGSSVDFAGESWLLVGDGYADQARRSIDLLNRASRRSRP